MGEEAKFSSLEIIKTASLGQGSFGQVYKARCGGLLCAAKILHPELAAVNPVTAAAMPAEELHKLPVMRFESECHLMRNIHHPNIVQYLGMWQDPSVSEFPVLLMELMDENLTTFLNNRDQPLPFHTQVTICRDISLALSFLHSNGIIHRDLSSNNVLMIGDRAKITDFGMARLFSLDKKALLTENPGTNVYMPPEASGNNSNYDISIDCFSFGVLVIQIVTLLYPSPTEDYKPVKGKKDLLKRVPEKTRRQSHTDLMEVGHPLCHLALDCISDEPVGRPTAQDMCRTLEEMKESERFVESVKVNDLVRENRELKENAKAMKQQHAEEISSLNLSHSGALEKLKDCHSNEMQKLEELHTQKLIELQAQREKDVDYLQQLIKSKENEMKFLQHNHNHDIMKLEQSHAVHLQSAEDGKEEWRAKYRQAKDQMKKLKTRIDELEGNGTVKGGSVRQDTEGMRNGRRSSDVTINWNLRGKQAPQPLHREDSESVFCNDTLYVRPAFKRTVFAYHPRLDKWKEMPRCPHKHSSLAHINSTVFALGGRSDALEHLNSIYYLTEDSNPMNPGVQCPPHTENIMWKEADFRLPTKRCSPMVVTAGSSLVVAGGEGDESLLRKVEVMDTLTKPHTWSTAANLPEALIFSSAALCGGHIHFLGGVMGYIGAEKRCMFSCSMDNLLRSCTRGRDRKHKPLVNTWRTTPGPPVTNSTCVAFRGQLLSIGGNGADGKPTSAVYGFNAETGTWSIVSYMCMPRSKCFAAVLPGDEILHRDEVLVVGGNSTNGKTDTLELGTV